MRAGMYKKSKEEGGTLITKSAEVPTLLSQLLYRVLGMRGRAANSAAGTSYHHHASPSPEAFLYATEEVFCCCFCLFWLFLFVCLQRKYVLYPHLQVDIGLRVY